MFVYIVFVYDDKSLYPSTNNMLQKKQSYVRRIDFRYTWREDLKKRSDLSLKDHKFDLIYCRWNTTEPDAVCNISFLMFSL